MFPSFTSVVLFRRCQPNYFAQNNFPFNARVIPVCGKFTKCSLLVLYNFLSACCSQDKYDHCVARKNKRTTRMFANTRKDHSIPLAYLSILSYTVASLPINKEYSFINPSIPSSISQLVSWSVGQPVSHSVNQSVSQSISHSVSKSFSQSVSPSVRQSVSQSVSHWITKLAQKQKNPAI